MEFIMGRNSQEQDNSVSEGRKHPAGSGWSACGVKAEWWLLLHGSFWLYERQADLAGTLKWLAVVAHFTGCKSKPLDERDHVHCIFKNHCRRIAR
jgi:hypothetical protein